MPHYLDKKNNGQSMDMSNVITRVCPCGSTWFRTVISIGEDYNIEAYGLDGECVECGTRVKLPCPPDLDAPPVV